MPMRHSGKKSSINNLSRAKNMYRKLLPPPFINLKPFLISVSVITVISPPKQIAMYRLLTALFVCVFICQQQLHSRPQVFTGAKIASFYESENGKITQYSLPGFTAKTIADKNKLTPQGAQSPVKVRNFFFSADDEKVLIYTNSKKVWRYDTRGDYWVLNLENNKLTQLGKALPASSLMFAKFSPDGIGLLM